MIIDEKLYQSIIYYDHISENLQVNFNGTVISIDIFNNHGILLFRSKIKKINVISLASGVYKIKVYTNKKVIKTKFNKN